MAKNRRLEDKIRSRITIWLDAKGGDLETCIYEFCQGNRASLSLVRIHLAELATHVFTGPGDSLNEELLGSLEYGIFI